MIATSLLTFIFQGTRWWLLIRVFRPDISLGVTLRYHFAGNFYSIILPTSTGQDFVRALLISTRIDPSVSWGSTWVQKIIGLIGTVAFCITGFALMDKTGLPPETSKSIIISCCAVVVLLGLSFSKVITSPVRKLFFEKIMPRSLLIPVQEIRQTIYLYRGKWKALAVSFFFMILVQLCVIFGSIGTVAGITGKVLVAPLMTFIPLIELILAVLPLTPSGIGLREGLIALLFIKLGLTNEQIGIYIAFGFLTTLLKVLCGLPFALTTRLRGKKYAG